MPIYEFDCPACGGFAAMRRLAQASEPADCPRCGTNARRVIASAPRLSRLSSAQRTAHDTNERSAHAPQTAQSYRQRHPAGCGCCSSHRTTPAKPGAQPRTGQRPWMISH